MCLEVNKNKTNKFKQVGKRKITVYKAVKEEYRTTADKYKFTVYDDIIGLKTPFKSQKVEAGWLKAETKAKIVLKETNQISCGAIHCMLEPKSNSRWRLQKYKFLKCVAYAEDFIAYGNDGDVAFKKIYIPLEEYERVLKLFKRKR